MSLVLETCNIDHINAITRGGVIDATLALNITIKSSTITDFYS